MSAQNRRPYRRDRSTTNSLLRRAVIGERLESRVLLSAYTFSTLASFNGNTVGANSEGGLIDVGNALYGTASNGGSNGLGTVFEYNLGLERKGASRLFSLASFDGSNGDTPEDGLTQIGSILYCATDARLSPNAAGGSVAQYNIATRALTTVGLLPESPDPDPNDHPIDGLIDVGGNLYGDTDSGDDAFLYECNLTNNSVTPLANLLSDRGAEHTDLLDLNGSLYGTVATSGNVISTMTGAIFKYNLSTQALIFPASFNGTDGTLPAAGLIDIGGNLYGTAVGGGANKDGTLIEFNPTTNKITTLLSFNGSDGSFPHGNLTDIGGNIFGTTAAGGTGQDGTVFEYNLSTKTLTTLANFNGTNGSSPNGFLTAVNGVIYGTTQLGGPNGVGTLFALFPPHPLSLQLSPAVNQITLRVDPANTADLEVLNGSAKYEDVPLSTLSAINVTGDISASNSVTVDFKTAGFFSVPVTFTGAGSHNSLSILDASNPTLHNWNVNTNNMMAVSSSWTTNPTIDYKAVQNVSLTTRAGGDETISVRNAALIGVTLPNSITLHITTNVAVNIKQTASPITIDGTGSASSTLEGVTIGSDAPSLGGTLAGILAPITVNNVSELIADDSGDTANRTGTISSSSITGFGLSGSTAIHYASVGQLAVHGGAGGNTDTISGTSAATTLYPGTSAGCTVNVKATQGALTINGNNKVDSVTIGSLAPSLGGTLTNIAGPITVTNTSAASTLTLDDSGDNTYRTGTLTPTQITGLGMGSKAVVNYTGKQLASITIRGGKKGGTLTETGTSTTTHVIGLTVKP